MLNYLLRRIVHAVIILFGISIIVFVTVRLTGDPATAMLSGGNPSKEAIEHLRHSLGLDKPLILQYLMFLRQVVTFNFGTSFATGQPVMQMITSRLGATFSLALGGVLVGIFLAIPVGVLSALKKGGWVDMIGRIFALLGISFPNFWLATMLILVFSVWLRWLPVSGKKGLDSFVLPCLTLGLILAGILARLVRSSMLEVLSSQYIQTARAKGLRETVVLIKHALRNALLPTVTYLGLQLGALLGGVVILEQVFSWPGIGRLLIESVSKRDYPVIQGTVLFVAALLMLVNLIVDLSYAFIDPRVKVGGGKS